MIHAFEANDGWRKSLLHSSATVQQAVVCLEQSATQIALVVSEGDTLVGAITDGDIRRGLLRGLTLLSPIDSLISRDPLVVPPEFSREMVLQLMRANDVHQMPVVDESRKVVGLHVLNELLEPKEKSSSIIVMAGGLGTRLHPHTETCPKPLLPVAGKPMLEHIVQRARSEGFRNFVFSVRYLGHMIEEYFGNGEKWDINIKYLYEDEPLGTAGALGILESVPNEAFIVTNGDVLTDIQYGELLSFHERNSSVATMAVRMHEQQHPFGVVETNGIEIVGFEEKPIYRSYVNAGVYALSPEVLDYISPNKRCDMPGLFDAVRKNSQRTVVYPMHEPWLDVGRPDDYDRAEKALSSGKE